MAAYIILEGWDEESKRDPCNRPEFYMHLL